ncbi:MAG TPA: acyl carrier protein [Pseudomonadales bacterium]|nr:acyl carrier protein [Pseudomonadales bacterium]
MSSQTAIYSRVKSVVEQTIPLKGKTIEPDARFIDDLGAESMDLVCMIMGLEDEFGGEIPQEDIQSLKTVADVVHYIEARINNTSLQPALAETI